MLSNPSLWNKIDSAAAPVKATPAPLAQDATVEKLLDWGCKTYQRMCRSSGRCACLTDSLASLRLAPSSRDLPAER